MSGRVFEKEEIDNGCVFVAVGLRVMRGDPEMIKSAERSNEERVKLGWERAKASAARINEIWRPLIIRCGLKGSLGEMPKDYLQVPVSLIGYGVFPPKINEDIANDFTGKKCIYSFSLEGNNSDIEICLSFNALPAKKVRGIIVNTIKGGMKGADNEKSGYKRLTDLASFPEGQHREAITAIIAKVKEGKEDPEEFFVKLKPDPGASKLIFILAHQDSFKQESSRKVGNPSGKDREAVYDPATKKIEFYFYQ